MQLYHSIHAKGENVEDVLREAEVKEAGEKSGPAEHTMTMETDAKSSDIPEADAEQV